MDIALKFENRQEKLPTYSTTCIFFTTVGVLAERFVRVWKSVAYVNHCISIVSLKLSLH